MAQRQITTTEDQSATFIELFDLVFVYAVTQTVSLLHHDLSWAGLWHAVVVLAGVVGLDAVHLGAELRIPPIQPWMPSC